MGTLYVVATPIGNLSDFSPRGIKTLAECDLILAEDTRQTLKLLSHFNIKNKLVSYHKFNEMKTADEIVEQIIEGKNIAIVSDAGTPCISDPGYILVERARKNNVEVIGIPGCSAVITALSVGGLDTSSFSFYGFVPTENKHKKALFKEIKSSKVKTKVIYESPKRVIKLLGEIKKEIPGCVVCVCSELTKIHERGVYGIIEEVYDKLSSPDTVLKGEYVILISNVVEEEKKDTTSLEAQIIDVVVKQNCSVKEAVKIINERDDTISKRDIYNAGLNLKQIIKK